MTDLRDRPTLVVVADRRWWLAPFGTADPTELSLDDVARLLDASAITGRATRDDGDDDPVRPDVVLAPLRTVVGHVEAGHLVATSTGSAIGLDLTDLRLLQALDGRATVEDLGVSADVEDRCRRLGRMSAAGIVHSRAEGGPAASDTPEEAGEPLPVVGATPMPPRTPGDPRVPVYSVWHPEVGPLLSLGMLTAAARHHDGGALNQVFDIRPPETADSLLADLATRTGPAILLCSDYVFTLPANLDTARRALRINPELVVLHGGPSSPKYEADAERFLDEHGPVAHVLTRGEGERTICELLEALSDGLPALDPTRLAMVDGLTFRDPSTGTTIRTPDRERITELDTLPSPFLSGEFDHVPASEWTQPPYFETNRGCPYGCTFCDWGSATQSRIRKFSLERLAAEFEWAADRGLTGVHLCDANFGILPRDLEVAQLLADLRARRGAPRSVMFSPAKNTTRHLTKILDVLADAGIAVNTSISLQTTDEDTLDVVGRHNISTDAYLALAADLRRRGHALTGDLIIGLPGQTYESFRSDVQFMVDHEIMPRTFSLRMLTNSPMNAPDYREQHGIEVNENGIVVSTGTMTEDDRASAARLRHAEIITERYGVLRHVMRYLQWDHGIPATAVMEQVLSVAAGDGGRRPSIHWLFNYFDLFPAPPAGWSDFYREVHQLVCEDLGVADSDALRCVLAVQEFLMPAPGRRFPDRLELPFDYVAYYASATGELYGSGHASTPARRLEEHPPGVLVVEDDPLGLSREGLWFDGDSRGEVYEGDFQIGALACNELRSPLVRLLPRLTGHKDMIATKLAAAMPDGPPELDPGAEAKDAVTVALLRRRGHPS